MALPSVAQMEAFIRRRAAELGIDPDIAVRVAKSEGLAANTWQSNLQQPYGREASYGPYQLHLDPTGKRPGLGNAFMKATGLNPADLDTWDEGIDFALKQAREGGWGPWMGAKKIGVTGFTGINGKSSAAADDAPAMGAAMGSFVGGPAEVQARMDDVPGLLDGVPASGASDFASMGIKIISNAKKKKEAEQPEAPAPMVLKPFQRNTLKGLLA